MLDIRQFLYPIGGIDVDIFLQHLAENIPDITYQRNRRTKIFSDFRRIDIDVNDLQLAFQILRFRYGAICHPGSHDDQKIAFADRFVRIWFTVVTQHTEIQRVILRHNAHPHHGVDQRNLIFFTEPGHLLLAVAQNHAAAGTDQRMLRFVDGRHHLPHLLAVSAGAWRLVAANPNFNVTVIKFLCHHRPLDIHRNIDKNRTLAPCIGNIKSLLENPRDVIYIIDQITIFGKGLCRACDVCLLEDITSQKTAVHLPGNRDNRNTVRISRCQSGNQIGCARPGGRDADCRPAGDSGHSARGVPCRLLSPDQYMLDFRIMQTVVKRCNCNARIAEHRFDALLLQTFHHCLCST